MSTTIGPGARAEVAPVLLAEVEPRRWSTKVFGVVDAGSVRRRPRDVLNLCLASVLVAGCFVVSDGFTARSDTVYRWLTDLTSWIGTMSTIVFVSCTVVAVAVIVLALLLTRNFRLALTLIVVGLVTGAAGAALGQLVDVDAVRRAAGPNSDALSAQSVVWLAVATAVLLAAAPYLVRPARRFVSTVQVVAVVAAVLAAVGPLTSLLAAVGLGWGLAAMTSLVVGTPKATPSKPSVLGTLDELGIVIDHLEIAEAQVLGETRFVGRAPDGRPASVVVIGRDAADAQLASKVGRSILFHDAGPSVSVTRSAQLEHRAYLLLMAAKAGVPVSEVVLSATGGPDDLALLALIEPTGTPLADLDPDRITDALLDDIWTLVDRLHRARLTHGQAIPSNVVVGDDGTVSLIDFAKGSIGAPPERQAFDGVELLATTAALVGDDRAVAAALRALGPKQLEELLPMLQTAALSSAARRLVPQPKKRLKALRAACAAACGCEEPKLAELRRVSASTVAMAAGSLLGFYLIVAQFAGVHLWDTLQTASIPWVVVAFAISFIPNFTGSISLMGAVNAPLPFGPVLGEQFANNFTGLVGGTVATTALVVRFFQKQGLKVAVAASSGIINSMASGIVEVVLVTIGLIFTTTQFTPSKAGGSETARLVLLAIVVVGVLAGVVWFVPKLRAATKRIVGPQFAAARENLRGILRTPRKAAMIFGGQLGSQVAFALVISAALHAYGTSLPLLQLIVINSLASILGGLAPVPGGMGVIEAGLIGGMTAAGVSQSDAVAATFTARACTAYLPPIWGWFALRWLRQHDFI